MAKLQKRFGTKYLALLFSPSPRLGRWAITSHRKRIHILEIKNDHYAFWVLLSVKKSLPSSTFYGLYNEIASGFILLFKQNTECDVCTNVCESKYIYIHIPIHMYTYPSTLRF